MFGWLKSLFGSEPAPELIVPPPLPKAKRAAKKADKPAAKKAAPKDKAAKAPRKKKEAVTQPVDLVQLEVAAPKKKGGRPKKVAEPAQKEQNSPNS